MNGVDQKRSSDEGSDNADQTVQRRDSPQTYPLIMSTNIFRNHSVKCRRDSNRHEVQEDNDIKPKTLIRQSKA